MSNARLKPKPNAWLSILPNAANALVQSWKTQKKAIENAEARLKSLEPQLLEKRRRQRAFSAKGMAFKPPATRLRTGSRNVELKLESLGIAKRTQWPLFINQRSIESVVLTRTRAEGDEVCTRIGGNCSVGVVQIRA